MHKERQNKRMAHEGVHCKQCGIWIAVGVRRVNQWLCTLTNEELKKKGGANRSECQKNFYNNRSRKIYKSHKLGTVQEEEGTMGCKKHRAPHYKTPKKRKPTKERLCLKCQKMFKSTGPYNRICEKCTSSTPARKAHSFMAKGTISAAPEDRYMTLTKFQTDKIL